MLKYVLISFLVSSPLAARIGFEKNLGQAPATVKFLARILGGTAFFTGTDVVFAPVEGQVVRLSFPGASPSAQWEAMGAPVDSINYFLGQDASRWVRDAPVHARLTWRGLYPGVDCVFYEHAGRLEYDLVLAAGTDAQQVRLRWSGAPLTSAEGGITVGPLRQHAPRIYQSQAEGQRQPVDGRFTPTGHAGEFQLALGHYDSSRPLIVDPLLELSTYIGGEQDDEVVAVGYGYVVGNTRSVLFPEAPVSRRPTRDIFIRTTGVVGENLVGSGTAPSAATLGGTTILGGSGDDEATAAIPVVFGRDTQVYVVGETSSRDWADGYKGGATDGFQVTLSIRSSARYSSGPVSYLGGSGEDRLTGIAATIVGYVAVGTTNSPDLTSVGPQKSLGGGRDAFFVVGDFRQSTSAYLGGSGDDAASSVALISSDQLLIGGETRSPDFPSLAANSAAPAGDADGFLALLTLKVTPDGLQFDSLRSWYVGGSGDDRVESVACQSSTPVSSPVFFRAFGSPCGFTGTTNSPNLRVANAAQASLAGGTDLFVGAFDFFNGAFPWLTYWGSSGNDVARSVALNWNADLFVGGYTRGNDLHQVDPVQPGSGGGEDGLFVLFESNGAVRQSTYFGGSGDDRILNVNLGENNLARVGGSTTSTDLRQVRATQTRGAGQEGFLADLGTAYLVGASEVIVPKDGSIFLPMRGALGPGVLVTYRSADPARVRVAATAINSMGAEQVTTSVDSGIRLEGLADSGEVLVTATAPGHAPKEIRVRLFPSAFVHSFTGSISSWATPIPATASVRAIDPVTNQFIGSIGSLRSGLSSEPVRWTSSDPTVIEFSTPPTGLFSGIPRRAGTTTVSYQTGSITSRATEVRVVEPDLLIREFGLGENLTTSFGPGFTDSVNGFSVIPPRGTITYRTESPAQMLLSMFGSPTMSESLTVPLTGASRGGVVLNGFASSGATRLLVTSSEFTGERAIPVRFEPLEFRAFATLNVPLGNEGNVSVTPVTASNVNGSLSLRTGAPLQLFRVENSNPGVLEMNRRTITFPNFSSPNKLTGLSPGTATLRVTSLSGLRVNNAEAVVTVGNTNSPQSPPLFGLPVLPVAIGKDLQSVLEFRYGRSLVAGTAPPLLRVSIDDPSLAVLSDSAQRNGGPRVELPYPSSGTYQLAIQGLRDAGETTVRLRLGEEPEFQFRVVLVPSAIGVVWRANSPIQDAITLGAVPLEERTLAALPSQTLRPGVQATVRLRVEGEPVALPQTATVSSTGLTELRFLRPAGDSVLVIEPPAGFTFSPLVSRYPFNPPPVSPTVTMLTSSTLAASNGVVALNLPGNRQRTTVTSLNPDRLLLSTTPNAPATPTVELDLSSSAPVYGHGQGPGGFATVSVRDTERLAYEMRFALYPVRASLGLTSEAILGQNAMAQITLAAGPAFGFAPGAWRKPGAPPLRFPIRSSNPDVLRVGGQFIEILEGQFRGTVPVTFVALGAAELIVDPPEDIEGVNNPRILVNVRDLRLSVVNPTFPPPAPGPIILGRNLQTEMRLSAERATPGGSIARVTSSDPARLVVSRSSSTVGSAAVSVAVPSTQLDPFFLQALGDSGDVTVTISLEGHADLVQTVSLRPSWLQASTQFNGPLAIGATAPVNLFPGFEGATRGFQLRPGLAAVRATVRSEPAGILSGLPATVDFRPDGTPNTVNVSGARPGVASILVDGGPLFVPLSSGVPPLAFEVIAPAPAALASSCSEVVLGKDTQIECTLPAATNVTVRTEDPGLVVISADPTQLGRGEISGTLSRFVLHGLASAGTAEVILSAPGMQPSRIQIVLRPTQIVFANSNFGTPITAELAVNTTRSYALQLQVTNTFPPGWSPRAGLVIPVRITVTPAGVVSVDPPTLSFGATPASRTLNIRALAPGNALIRVTADGFPDSSFGTLTVRVP